MKSKKQNKNGFTLLEILVVVLIIGILAAVALPQYQMAVGKAQFATIKALTRNVQDAAQRYYFAQNTYEDVNSNLDIDIPNGIDCYVWISSNQVMCAKTIFGVEMRYYIKKETGRPDSCLVYNTNKTSKANRLCQKETGSNGNCNTAFCSYHYPYKN